VRQEWNASVSELMVLLLLGAFLVALAMNLAGWTSRRSWSPAVLILWLLVWFAVIPTLLVTPVLALFVSVGGGSVTWGQLLAVTWVSAAICFAVLLPFLILARLNSLFWQRLEGLFRAREITQPTSTPEPAPHCSS
jgi:hypothetical protein